MCAIFLLLYIFCVPSYYDERNRFSVNKKKMKTKKMKTKKHTFLLNLQKKNCIKNSNTSFSELIFYINSVGDGKQDGIRKLYTPT